MRYILFTFLLILSLHGDDTAYGKGEKLYFSKGCNGCHGTNASGINEYPSLANRAKGFLIYKLKKYRNGEISNQQALLMTPYAGSLNDEEIDLITTFLHEYVDNSTDRYDDSYETHGDGGS